MYGRYIIEIIILYIIFRYKFKRSRTDLILNKDLINKLISEFKPEPLVDNIDPVFLKEEEFNNSKLIEAADYDFYNLKNENKEDMITIIKSYGVGTCGPPGFYGTLDLHLELEAKISEVLGTEASILYSNSFTCINSVITCFCRQYDNVIYHSNCNEAIIRALSIIKGGSVVFFDLNDLEEKIKKFYQKGKRNFIIAEALFRNTGEILNLPRLIEIKNRYKVRLILDESLSIPLLGKRGISEYYNTDIREIDVIIGSFAHVFCGNGGFASGSTFVANYQRLSAQSYCFSASMPGFLTKNAMINIARDYKRIRSNGFHKHFFSTKYTIISDVNSPMIVLARKDNTVSFDIDKDMLELRAIKSYLNSQGIRIGIIENPSPSLRVCIKQEFSDDKTKEMAIKISEALDKDFI